MNLTEAIQTYLPQIEAEMQALLTQPLGEERSSAATYGPFYGMAHYHLGWVDETFQPTQADGGKRIRPLLCLLTCQAAGGDPQRALPAAAAIEVLHNFSLIHDDIEDNDRLRRGRPTVWALWGIAQAINVGDLLFALAHLALGRLEERGVPSDRVLQALRRFDETCIALTQGQYLDLDFEARAEVSVEDYLTMIAGKTAALLSTSAYLGALLAGATTATCRAYEAFGRHLGMAFQIEDDILGIWGEAETTGKAASDIAHRKKTLPIVYGLSRSPALRALYEDGEMTPQQEAQVRALLEEVGARNYAAEMARQHHAQAMAALERANPIGPAAQALWELAGRLLGRVR